MTNKWMDGRYGILTLSCNALPRYFHSLSFSLFTAPFWSFWRTSYAVGSSRPCFRSPIKLWFEIPTRTTWRTSSCLWHFIRLQTTPSSPWSQHQSIVKWCVISDFYTKHISVIKQHYLYDRFSFDVLQCSPNLCLFLSQFRKIFDELMPGLEAILAAGHMGIIVQVVESCVHREERQADILRHLLEVKLGYCVSAEAFTEYTL